MLSKGNKEILLGVLRFGKENRLTNAAIRDLIGFSPATVRINVKKLREAHFPIVSNSKTAGYWLSSDTEEIQHTILELQHRREEMNKTIDALERTLYTIENHRLDFEDSTCKIINEIREAKS